MPYIVLFLGKKIVKMSERWKFCFPDFRVVTYTSC